MTDEQPSGMEPKAAIKRRRLTEDQPLDDAPDTEGHGVKFRPFTDDEQVGSETGTEATEDSEGHGWRSPVTEDAPSEPNGGATRKF